MRPVTPEDYDKITHLLDQAFTDSRSESTLVTQLRRHGKSICEWVVDDANGIVGYICYSRAFRGHEMIGYHLAPVAVRIDAQRRGIGSSLILESLKKVGDGCSPVFVLGDPLYYHRFGFSLIENPICPFDPTNEHFMALRWTKCPAFTIGYEEEFTASAN